MNRLISEDSGSQSERLIAAAQQQESTPFDYVIVGSGAGGGPLAARLALGGKRVLLIEAGQDAAHAQASLPGAVAGEAHDCPGYHAAATEDEEMSWQFSTRHYNDDARQAKDEKYNRNNPLPKYLDPPPKGKGKQGIFYPRSSGIGGCTGHHAMIMVTPNDCDWNDLADLTGDDSWRAEKMRGYFARLERCLYPAAYNQFLGMLLGIVYKAWRRLALLLDPRGVLDQGGHGTKGWQPTSFIDPKLIESIAQEDRGFVSVLARTALSVLHRDKPLVAMLKRALFRFRVIQQIDPNDQNTRRVSPQGVFLIPVGIGNGRRTGLREFLLKTAQEKPKNLVIATGYHVTRVLFAKAEGDDVPRAIGVEAAPGNHLYEASPKQKEAPEERVRFFSKGEVILCGGAFNTPQLLMLSGIGEKEHLAEHGVDGLTGVSGEKVHDVIDLPGVGCNLQDRYEVSVISELNKPFTTLNGVTFTPGDANDPARTEWRRNQTGLYATNGGTLAIMRRSSVVSPDGPPDLFIFGAPAAFRGYYWGWSRELLRRTQGAEKDQRDLWSWIILKAYTRNHAGTVRLRTANPFDIPDICFDSFNEKAELRSAEIAKEMQRLTEAGLPVPAKLAAEKAENDRILLDSQRDLQALQDAVRFMREVNDCNPEQFQTEIQPGPKRASGSDEMKEWLRTQAWGHHASCTCRIGSDAWQADTTKIADRGAVLDSRFRVHGVRGLRVVDASVFPKIPGYFILTPILMVSEKAADTLLQDSQETVYPAAFRREEAQAIAGRRRIAQITPAAGVPAPAAHCLPADTVGLALSGGGIRSATFSLGFLQAMSERNRLRDVDLLSTVSGGGFIGSFLGRLFTRSTVETTADPCGRVQDVLKDTSSSPIWWLRTQANYIFATGVSDLRQNLAIYWRNVFTVHLVIGALLFAAFGLLRGVAPYLPDILKHAPAEVSLLGLPVSPWWWLPVAVLALGVLPGLLGYWLAPRQGVHWPHPVFAFLALVVLMGGAVAALAWPGALPYAGGALALLLLSWIWQEAARWGGPKGDDPAARKLHNGILVRNRLTRSLGEAIVLFVALAAWVVLDTFTQAVAQMNLTATLSAIVVALAPVLPFLRFLAQKAAQRIASPMDGGGSLLAIGNLIGIPLAIFLGFMLNLLAHDAFLQRPAWAWGLVTIAALFSLVLGRAFHFLNLSSLQAAYAARLARTFLGASNASRIYADDVDDARDVRTAHPDDDIPLNRYHPEHRGGPLHLINVCINETVDFASERQIRERKGLPMSIGPTGISVGRRYFAKWADDDQRGQDEANRLIDRIRQPDEGLHSRVEPIPASVDPNGFHVLASRSSDAPRVEGLSLSSWTAISGAAFNTGSGRNTKSPMAFFMGFVNFRLGYWWDSGIRASDRPGRYPLSLWSIVKRLPSILFRMQSLLLSEWRARFTGPSRRFWYLSDGGHFEVTGLYELIRRRVPFMILADGGEDPRYQWNDLAQLTRQAREDFGAQITWIDPRNAREAKLDGWTAIHRAITEALGEQVSDESAGAPVRSAAIDSSLTHQRHELPTGTANGGTPDEALELPGSHPDRRSSSVNQSAAYSVPELPGWVREWMNPDALGALQEITRNGQYSAALARVTYDGSSDVSWLLLVKPSITADLSQDIQNYAATHSSFPQDPTYDQIFNDAQWESYRALGQHIGRRVLRPRDASRTPRISKPISMYEKPLA